MLRRFIFVSLFGLLFSLLLGSAGSGAIAQPARVTLPPSSLNVCQYGFAVVRLRVPTVGLAAIANSNGAVIQYQNGPNVVLLVSPGPVGVSNVTVAGMMRRPNGTLVPFSERIVVRVNPCPGAGGGGGGGGPGPNGPVNFGVKPGPAVCVGDEWDYTFNIRAADGSNTVHILTARGGNVASVDQIDNASQTVRGHGLIRGVQAVAVTGYVEAVSEDIAFTVTISVTVKPRPGPGCPLRG